MSIFGMAPFGDHRNPEEAWEVIPSAVELGESGSQPTLEGRLVRRFEVPFEGSWYELAEFNMAHAHLLVKYDEIRWRAEETRPGCLRRRDGYHSGDGSAGRDGHAFRVGVFESGGMRSVPLQPDAGKPLHVDRDLRFRQELSGFLSACDHASPAIHASRISCRSDGQGVPYRSQYLQ